MGFIHIQNSNLEGYYKLSGGTAIPNGANLTGYKTPGNYYCPNNTVAAILTGSPTKKAFTLKVELSTGNSYPCQTIRDFATGKIYFRTFNIDTNAWSEWGYSIQNADFLTKIVSLNQVTVPANAGIAGSTTNISGQIPSGYKLLDAREVGSGNNGCYIYYFRADGTNITLQLRNVTNATITTSPSAQLLLIPK